MAKRVIYYFNGAIFFLKTHTKETRNQKKFGLFQRTYFMDSTLAKNSTTITSEVSQLSVLIQ